MSPLTREEQVWLLGLARRALEARLSGERLSLSPRGDGLAASLREPAGAFVSLHAQGRLRGCVGYSEARKPLFLAVADAALAAAFNDFRFPPLRGEELDGVEIEISVLSSLFPIAPEQIVVGEHGLLLSQGAQRGLLLPQVAVEHGWSREKFLEETCLKAGLERDAWEKGAKIEAFTARIFSESALHAQPANSP